MKLVFDDSLMELATAGNSELMLPAHNCTSVLFRLPRIHHCKKPSWRSVWSTDCIGLGNLCEDELISRWKCCLVNFIGIWGRFYGLFRFRLALRLNNTAVCHSSSKFLVTQSQPTAHESKTKCIRIFLRVDDIR